MAQYTEYDRYSGAPTYVDEEVVETISYADKPRRGNFLDVGYNNVRTQSNTFVAEPTRKTYSSNYQITEEVVQPRSFGKSVGGGYRPYQEYKPVRNAGTTTAVERIIEPTRTAYAVEEIDVVREPVYVENTVYERPAREVFEVEVVEPQREVYREPEIYRREPVVEREVRAYIEEPVAKPVKYEDGDFVDLNDAALLDLIRNEVAEVGDNRKLFSTEIQPTYAYSEKEFTKYEDEEAAPGWFCGMCVAPRKKKEKKTEKIYAPAPVKYERPVEVVKYERPVEVIETVVEPTRVMGEPARVLGYREEGTKQIYPDPITSYDLAERRGGDDYYVGGRRDYVSGTQVLPEVVDVERSRASGISGRRY